MVDYEKYLNESFITNGYTDTGGLSNNDDRAPNTVLMGDVTVKTRSLDSINGKLNIHKPISDYYWHELEYAEAAADKNNYSSTLLGVDKLVQRDDFDMFKHTDPNFKMEQRPSRPDQRPAIHQIGLKMDRDGVYKDIYNKIKFYMDSKGLINNDDDIDREPHPKGKKVSTKALGVDVVVNTNEECISYKYYLNEDITLDLIDIVDEEGYIFEYSENDGVCEFTIKRRD